MSSTYNADAIEVLTGLDPVRKRPGMYTDTTRPNHLLQEVVDNSVDEALAGFASNITLTLYFYMEKFGERIYYRYSYAM